MPTDDRIERIEQGIAAIQTSIADLAESYRVLATRMLIVMEQFEHHTHETGGPTINRPEGRE